MCFDSEKGWTLTLSHECMQTQLHGLICSTSFPSVTNCHALLERLKPPKIGCVYLVFIYFIIKHGLFWLYSMWMYKHANMQQPNRSPLCGRDLQLVIWSCCFYVVWLLLGCIRINVIIAFVFKIWVDDSQAHGKLLISFLHLNMFHLLFLGIFSLVSKTGSFFFMNFRTWRN